MATTTLTGMKAICTYVNRSEATVLDWIRTRDFPAKKLGGIYESDTASIDVWRTERLAAQTKKDPKKDPKRGRFTTA